MPGYIAAVLANMTDFLMADQGGYRAASWVNSGLVLFIFIFIFFMLRQTV
jgi:hypothetical protein